jgi:hypothetical protein
MHADDRPGRWRRYFRKWHRVTRAELPASELELVPALRRFVPPAEIVDKPAYQEGHPQHSSPSWGMNCERAEITAGAGAEIAVRVHQRTRWTVHDSGLPADG